MTLKIDQLQIIERKSGIPLFSTVSIVVQPGEIATVMGGSGCGKSTLLSAISGSLDRYFSYTGHISLKGVKIDAIPMEKRKIGILFQDDLLFPHFNIEQNLAFAIPQGTSKIERDKIIKESLSQAELSGFEKRDPITLSGGQRARISLLRTLISKPDAILLDEPFSKLDQKLKETIRKFVFSTLKKMEIPALLVTHDPADLPGGRVINLDIKKGERC